MDIDKEELANTYAQMSDEELIMLYSAETLTDLANEVISIEIKKRSIDLSKKVESSISNKSTTKKSPVWILGLAIVILMASYGIGIQAMITVIGLIVILLPIIIAFQNNHPRKLLITLILIGSMVFPTLFLAVISKDLTNTVAGTIWLFGWALSLYLCLKKPKLQDDKNI